MKNDLSGKSFGNWTVGVEHRVIRRNTHWLCTCSCGDAHWVHNQYLILKTSTKCVDCGRSPRGYSGKVPKSFVSRIKRLAERRNIEFNISIAFLNTLMDVQQHRCALSGVTISVPQNATKEAVKAATASLDRVNPSYGYIEQNVQWVHKSVNIMKNVFTQDELIGMCHAVANSNFNLKPWNGEKSTFGLAMKRVRL